MEEITATTVEKTTKTVEKTAKTKKKKTPKQTPKEKLAELWRDKRSYGKRLLTAALASLALVFTVFVFGPFEIYLGNQSFFTFAFEDLLWPIVFAGAGLFVVLAVLLSLLRGKIYNYAVSFVFSMAVGLYVQGNFLNVDHGSLDGTSIIWQDYQSAAFLGMLFWGLLIIAPLVVQYFSRKLWWRVVTFGSVLVIGVQAVALTVLCVDTHLLNVGTENGYLTRTGIYEVAEQKNVIVFMLDRFDKTYADHQLEGYSDSKITKTPDPVITEGLRGFTYYENFTGSYTYTFPSVTYLLTGIPTDYTTPVMDYFEKAWTDTPFLSDIRAAGYDCRVYSEVTYIGGSSEFMHEEADNLGAPTGKIPAGNILSAMYGLSAYRYLPEIMKPYFHTYTGDISYGYIYGDEEGNVPYAVDDVRFREDLLRNGLTVNPASKGVFLFYHLQGSHDPFVMNGKGEKTTFRSFEEGRFEQTRGNLRTVMAYIEMLKELGVYDDTTIIITADHGYTGRYTELNHERVLSLFIKPAGADTTVPLQRSQKQICQDNLRASITSYFGLLDENRVDENGNIVDKLGHRPIELIGEDEELVRYFRMSAVDKKKKFRDYNLITYKITGDANDFANWERVCTEKIEYPYYDPNGR